MRERPRVLVIGINYAPEATGIAPYTRRTAAGLAERYDVQVVTCHPHYPEWRVAEGYGGWVRDERIDGVRVHRVGHYVPRRPTGVSRVVSEATFAARALAARMGRPDAVVVVSPALLPVASAALLARRWGVPLGVVVQDVYSKAFAELGLLGGRLDRAALGLERRLLGAADGVVAIHRRMADTLERDLRVPADALTVIPNWAHVRTDDTTDADREAQRRRLGWDDGRLVVLHAGNLGAKQGLEHLLPAGRLADQRGTPVRFVLMGSGGRRDELEAAARGIGSVEFLDPRSDDDFVPTLRAADVLLLHERPGMKEMCVPSKLTSYFAAGRPVLAATDAASAAAYEVTASGAGRVVEPGVPEALVDAVEALRAEPGLDALGRQGTAYARRTLDERAALDAYRAWVARLLARNAD